MPNFTINVIADSEAMRKISVKLYNKRDFSGILQKLAQNSINLLQKAFDKGVAPDILKKIIKSEEYHIDT